MTGELENNYLTNSILSRSLENCGRLIAQLREVTSQTWTTLYHDLIMILVADALFQLWNMKGPNNFRDKSLLWGEGGREHLSND